MLKMVHTVDEINCVMMWGWGEQMEGWNYFHYLGMCPIVEVQHIENNVGPYYICETFSQK